MLRLSTTTTTTSDIAMFKFPPSIQPQMNDTPFPQGDHMDDMLLPKETQGIHKDLPSLPHLHTIRRKKSSFDLRDMFRSGGSPLSNSSRYI
ncbi:hypothetical protein AcW1_006630 [Taiwanofungus camphoratus]|nr:hypothetical protein AcW2_005391 [Antrodia cinnamomea]KAI0954864.1 hypothetical protein AcW1_006630 [Antrodia cinnamomea]